MRQFRILWVSPRFPLPADSGAKRATMSLLEDLMTAGKHIGFQIHLDIISLYNEDPTADQLSQLTAKTQAQSILSVKKDHPLAGINALEYFAHVMSFSERPFTVQKCGGKKVQEKINAWSAEKTWDATVLDGLHAAAMLDLTDKKWGTLYQRSHNVESDLWLQMLNKEKGFLNRQVLKYEYKKFLKYEKKITQQVKKTFTVSQDDLRRFGNLFGAIDTTSLPIGLTFSEKPQPPSPNLKKIQLLFLGRLDWLPNKEGLKWFLDQVWPKLINKNTNVKTELNLEQKNYHLQIIGSGNSTWLEPYLSDTNITIKRNAEDLKPYYETCHLSIIPLFVGSGTRVKAIESGSQGRTFISTTIGVEGLPIDSHKDYYQANSVAEWVKVLEQLDYLDLVTRSANIHQELYKNFEQKQIAQKFLKDILPLQ